MCSETGGYILLVVRVRWHNLVHNEWVPDECLLLTFWVVHVLFDKSPTRQKNYTVYVFGCNLLCTIFVVLIYLCLLIPKQRGIYQKRIKNTYDFLFWLLVSHKSQANGMTDLKLIRPKCYSEYCFLKKEWEEESGKSDVMRL